jgi:transcriptional regulator with XRE-family HTH domain
MGVLREFCVAVKQRRSEIGITQATLVKISGLSRATVCDIEKCDIKDLSLGRAERLSRAIGLTLSIGNPHCGPEAEDSALARAAMFASKNQRKSIDVDFLKRVFTSDVYLGEYDNYLRRLLAIAEVALLAEVVESLHLDTGIERSLVWQRMRALAMKLGVQRPIWD